MKSATELRQQHLRTRNVDHLQADVLYHRSSIANGESWIAWLKKKLEDDLLDQRPGFYEFKNAREVYEFLLQHAIDELELDRTLLDALRECEELIGRGNEN